MHLRNLINALNQIKPPFNVNRAALFAAVAALKDNKWLKKEIKHINKWKKYYLKHLKK